MKNRLGAVEWGLRKAGEASRSSQNCKSELCTVRAAGLASLGDALGLCAAVDLLSGWFQRCGGLLRCVVS